MRAVIYNDHRGGYIDNVPSTFTRKNTDIGIHYADYPRRPTACARTACRNARLLRAARQPDHQQRQPRGQGHQPGRLPGRPRRGAVQVQRRLGRADHAVVPEHGLARACSTSSPTARTAQPLGPSRSRLFNPAFDKDKFESTAWTFNGKIGDLKAVYTGGYLVRNVDQVGDYTNYARGVYADYYQCYGPGNPATTTASTSDLLLAERHLASTERNDAPAARIPPEHAGRLARARHRRRVLGGQQALRPDDWLLQDTSLRAPRTTSRGTRPATPAASPTSARPGHDRRESRVQNDNTSFYQDTVRETKQTAFFASVDFDLIPKVLTLTAGTRHFRFHELQSAGSVTGSFVCFDRRARPAAAERHNYNLNAESARHRVRLQEPRQPDLAHHPRRHGVLHLLAGLPAGRLQPEWQRRARNRHRWQCRST